MGEVKLIQLYLASSLEDLNKMVDDVPNKNPKLLVKTAQKLVKEAQICDSKRDEERAYLLYMRYFQVVKKIQKHSEYTANRKYYDGLLDPRTTKKVIDRAEELLKSLERRYDFASGATRAEKMEEERRILEEKEREREREREREAKKSGIAKGSTKTTPSPVPVANGVVDDDRCISCQKLYNIMKERCSTYLVLDARPRADYADSHMTLANVINVPEEILKPGLTAGKIGSELAEADQTLWVMQRHNAEFLVLVDWRSEHPPLPPPLKVLSDAMLKWDPGKPYKGVPKLLQGGYELWCLMYPMLSTNARVVHPSAPTSDTRMDKSVALNFEYPNLDDAFISTPSPPVTPNTSATTTTTHYPDLTHTTSNTPNAPQVIRTLKPKTLEKEIMDSRNNNTLANNIFPPTEDTTVKPSLGSNVNTWESKESNIALEQRRAKQGGGTLPEKVDNVSPFVPSRSLKPKDLLASLAANKKDLDEEQKLLEESLQIEEDTMKKMEEMEATSSQRETTKDEMSRAILQATEDRLREEIRKLENKGQEMEESYKKMQKQNEELWKMVNLALANKMSGMSISPATQPDVDSERKKQEEEQEKLRKQKEQKAAMQEQVERMRKERKEKERRMKEQEERERKIREQKAREAEAERQKQEERKSRIDTESRPLKTKGSGDSYTTKLRGSPRSSPVRGSNLRRCHSAFNLSQQEEEQDSADTVMPCFDRTLKPRVTPQRRNINAARQRNFEPKYGSVLAAKTGLKNLGNTCYMNSIVQCLNNTKLFVKYFLDDTYSNDINPNSASDGEVAEEVGAVVRALWSGQYRSIAMWDLKNAVGRYHRPFCGYDQHDSHEFLLKLMDWLSDDLNKVTGKRLPMKEQNHENVPEYVAADKVMEELRQRDQSILSAVFHGLHRSTIECGTCGHVSLTFEPFSVLSLSFPNNRKCSLRDLLHHYYKETNLEYTCSKCNKKRNCIRKADIWKLPPVLILHLNRFEHDVLMKKKQNFVDFPMESLDLTKFTCFSNRYTKFDLYAVCNHYGTMDGGHYTAFCRSPINNKTWYKFDDHEVYEHCSVKTSAAYLLFYEATNTSMHINNLV